MVRVLVRVVRCIIRHVHEERIRIVVVFALLEHVHRLHGKVVGRVKIVANRIFVVPKVCLAEERVIVVVEARSH